MSAYRMWTLTCDGCGEVFDSGAGFRLRDERARARREARWRTGQTRKDGDYCAACAEKMRRGLM